MPQLRRGGPPCGPSRLGGCPGWGELDRDACRAGPVTSVMMIMSQVALATVTAAAPPRREIQVGLDDTSDGRGPDRAASAAGPAGGGPGRGPGP